MSEELAGPLTEQTIKQALLEAKGDLFVAAALLTITPRRLDSLIQASSTMQAVYLELKEARKKGDYDRLSMDAIEHQIARRMALGRATGLDALEELATMPISDNSAQNQVKLAAAARLAGETATNQGSSEGVEILRELNNVYQSTAKRITVIRQTMYRLDPPDAEQPRVIESEPHQP